jgi:hypothetical protein
MTRLGIVCLPLILLAGLAGPFSLHAEAPRPAPDFKEVYDLLRAHLTEVNEAELNAIAVRSLLATLGPKASLVEQTPSQGGTDSPVISKSSLFEGPIGYIRVNRVDQGLDRALGQTCQEIAATNKLNGIVIDLRFAGGTDYAAAAATADLFARKEQPLLDWGQGMVRTKEKTDSITTPVAILVNQKTSGAAEALAAALREEGAGLILGSRTAGQALIAHEYPLKDGERLRIATAPIQLGDGSRLSAEGIKPDISVQVSPADELAYFADAFKELARAGAAAGTGAGATNGLSSTNRVRRPRFNEAELVRERKDGLISDAEGSGSLGSDSEKPTVRDPVLARALDFLKALSVVRQTRF